MLDTLPDPQREVVELIIRGPTAWQWLAPVPADRVGPILAEMHSTSRIPQHEARTWSQGLNGHTAAALELIEAGVLERWEHPTAAAVTLSVAAADRMNLVLGEFVDGGESRWLHPEDAKDLYVRRERGTVEMTHGELRVDPHPGPAEEAEIARYTESDMPIMLLGRLLFVDPKLAKGKGKRKAKA